MCDSPLPEQACVVHVLLTAILSHTVIQRFPLFRYRRELDLERERRNVAVQQWDMLYGGVGQLDDLARMALRVAGEAQQAWAGTAVGQAVLVVDGAGVVRGGSDGSVGDGDTKHRGARRQSGGRDGCRSGRDDRSGGSGGGGGYRHTGGGVAAVDGVEAKLLEAKIPGSDAGSMAELSMLLVGEGGGEMGRETGRETRWVRIDGEGRVEEMATDMVERKGGSVVRRDEGVLFLAERQKREVSLRFGVWCMSLATVWVGFRKKFAIASTTNILHSDIYRCLSYSYSCVVCGVVLSVVWGTGRAR